MDWLAIKDRAETVAFVGARVKHEKGDGAVVGEADGGDGEQVDGAYVLTIE